MPRGGQAIPNSKYLASDKLFTTSRTSPLAAAKSPCYARPPDDGGQVRLDYGIIRDSKEIILAF